MKDREELYRQRSEKEYCFDCNSYHYGPICKCLDKGINKEKLSRAMIDLQVKYERLIFERFKNESIDNNFRISTTEFSEGFI